MNPTEFQTIKQFTETERADWEITNMIQEEGWRLISVKVEGADSKESQQFVYLLGHKEKK